MLVQRAYKTELDLSDRQVTACRRHGGAARWAYNWGLRAKQEQYQATKMSPTAIALHRELNALKKTQVPWMYQVSKCAPQEALWNAGRLLLRSSFDGASSRSKASGRGSWAIPSSRPRKRGRGAFGSLAPLW